MRGLVTRKTPSGYAVAQIHYTADPEKDPTTPLGREWLVREIQGYKGGMRSPAWQREMEINWRASAGRKVFEGLEELEAKVLIPDFKPPDHWHIGGGYDWGKSNPFAYIEGTQGGDTDKYVVYGAYGAGYEIPSQATLINRSPFRARVENRFADPSIWTEADAQKDGSYTSKQKLFADEEVVGAGNAVHFARGKTDDIACVDRIIAMLFKVEIDEKGLEIRTPRTDPKLKIALSCKFFWDELIDLRWDDFSPTVEQSRGKKETIKQIRNHAWDAFKYWLLSTPDEPTMTKEITFEQAIEKQMDPFKPTEEKEEIHSGGIEE